MKKLIVVCGPTGSGKSALAMRLAEKMGGEIIGADSMQIYKYMDIGTAKPSRKDRAEIPHHMIDFLEPGEQYSAARYAQDAEKCVKDVLSRGGQSIVCGGTGLYIDALVKGTDFAPFDPDIRRRLEKEWDEQGPASMLEKLSRFDPQTAEKLGENDKKRVIRALEMIETEGVTPTEHNAVTAKAPKKYEAVTIGLLPEPREYLYKRIDERAAAMFENGLLEEVDGLLKNGLLKGTAAQAIGYKEVAGVFSGQLSREQALEIVQRKSRNYAKRQITWFKKTEGIRWVSFTENDPPSRIWQASTLILREQGIEW